MGHPSTYLTYLYHLPSKQVYPVSNHTLTTPLTKPKMSCMYETQLSTGVFLQIPSRDYLLWTLRGKQHEISRPRIGADIVDVRWPLLVLGRGRLAALV